MTGVTLASDRLARAEIDRVARGHFLPYQERWIADESGVKFWEKSRRVGADYTESYAAVVSRLAGRNPRDYWYSSADESAAKEQAIYTKRWCKLFNLVYDEFEGSELIDGQRMRVMSITLPEIHGRAPRMTFMTSSPTGFRSKGGDVVLSEFAHHKQAAEMWQAAAPTAMRGGTISVISTHFGEHSEFNRLLSQARRRLDPATYGPARDGDLNASVHRVTIDDAIADGLVENINDFEGTSYTREAFRAEQRARAGSEDRWLEEYMCVPSAQSASFFPTVLLATCTDDKLPNPTDDLGRFLADVAARSPGCSTLNAGCDVGRINDRFVLWVWGRLGLQRVTLGILVYQGRDFAAMETAFNALMGARFPGGEKVRPLQVRRSCIDATGLGMQMAERMERKWRGRVEGVNFTAAVKDDIFSKARAGFEESTLLIPDNDIVVADFTGIRRTVTSAGHSRYDAEANEHGHADLATAAALGLLADESGKPMMRAVRVRGEA